VTDLQAVRYRARANWIGPKPDSVLRLVRSLLSGTAGSGRRLRSSCSSGGPCAQSEGQAKKASVSSVDFA